MVKHLVMWKFKSDVTEEQIQQMKSMLEALVEKVPSLVSMSAGRDFSRKARSWDFAICTEFKSQEGLSEYATHPEHVKVAEYIGSLVTEAAAVDYEG